MEKNRGVNDDNGIDTTKHPEVRKCEAAKSRWILLGFEDPDIENLERSVPTPATEDVPMALQLMASIKAPSWTADVASAFGQSIKGQRRKEGGKRLFAYPPKEGIPGEEGSPKFTD